MDNNANFVNSEYIRIKTNSDDNLPLKKPLIMCDVMIVIRSVFEDIGIR